jgi:membrane protein YqaA with SNARE-associated domain
MDAGRRETLLGCLRFAAGLGALVLVVTVLGVAFRPELSRFAQGFVGRFGFGGMLVGSALADGVHFPIPPQFYLFTGIASGHSRLVVFAVVLAGSELGGLAAFESARFVAARSAFVRARLAAPRRLLEPSFGRSSGRARSTGRDLHALVVATLLPIGYQLLCMTGGAMRLPHRTYVIFALARLIRLTASYVVIVLAWRGTH